MKEATGEANMTVVTIILIAIIVAVATPIVNSMMKNTSKQSCCMNDGGIWKNGNCYKSCTGVDANGNVTGCSTSYTPVCSS